MPRPPAVDESVRWLAEHLPAGIRERVPESMRRQLRPVPPPPPPSYSWLKQLMKSNFTVDNLVATDRQEFRRRIEGFQDLEDAAMEGYDNSAGQRRQSVKFKWYYDHDFGDFKVSGSSGDRHLRLLATFIDELPALPRDLTGTRVLDIGCYTGATSLLFTAMGASVVGVEEVKKYADLVEYFAKSFAIDLEVDNSSMYKLTAPEYQDAFDYVLFAGLLYHLSDPVLGLRIAFNSLKPGGRILLNSRASHSNEKTLEYQGPNVNGDRINRPGTNWFFPSPSTTAEMLGDVGFEDVRTIRGPYWVSAVATKKRQVDMIRAGLSVPDIR
jgi:2-polyprenyl-3-methyl-5-hydroxy-6-metoxy-1,4-benzoquinol methylase